jgi:hypothetical protein
MQRLVGPWKKTLYASDDEDSDADNIGEDSGGNGDRGVDEDGTFVCDIVSWFATVDAASVVDLLFGCSQSPAAPLCSCRARGSSFSQ